MSGAALTSRDLNRATLARQMLLERETVPAVEAVERQTAIQAQDTRPPYIGLWSRVTGFGRDDLHAAYHDRTAVRATMMRGTLHTMTAADYAAVRAALAPMLAAAGRGFEKTVDAAAAVQAGRELLADGPKTMTEIRAAFAERFPEEHVRPMAYLARLNVPLVLVPNEDRWSFGRDSAFALAEQWLGRPLDADAGPEALITRYLRALGPASAKDVEVWGGPPKAKAILEAMDLVALADERGRTLYDLPDAPRPGGDVPAPVRLIGDFDSMVLSHEDRTRIVADEHRSLLMPSKNLRVKATFLVDGFVAGIWSAQRKGRKATLSLEPFVKVKQRDVKALCQEAEALLHFLEPDAASFDVAFSG